MNDTTHQFTHWSDIENTVEEVIRQINERRTRIDHIIAVAQGGLIPASMIFQAFPQAHFHVVRCKTYERPGHAREPRITQYIPFSTFDDPKTLVVDEICDSGATFALLQKFMPHATFASLYVREESSFNPEFWGEVVPKGIWIDFPWERAEEKADILF